MKQIRAYFSHAIRGRLGLDADEKTIRMNCDIAISAGKIIGRHIPNLELYVPGEHDEFVQLAYKKGYITETEILDVDCSIIDRCDILLVYDWEHHISRGMSKEINHAREQSIPIFIFSELNDTVIENLKVCLSVIEGLSNVGANNE